MLNPGDCLVRICAGGKMSRVPPMGHTSGKALRVRLWPTDIMSRISSSAGQDPMPDSRAAHTVSGPCEKARVLDELAQADGARTGGPDKSRGRNAESPDRTGTLRGCQAECGQYPGAKGRPLAGPPGVAREMTESGGIQTGARRPTQAVGYHHANPKLSASSPTMAIGGLARPSYLLTPEAE